MGQIRKWTSFRISSLYLANINLMPNCTVMSVIDEANAQLTTALQRLEGALDSYFVRVGDPDQVHREVVAMSDDRAKLAEELERSKNREKELSKVAYEASEALAVAIGEIEVLVEHGKDTDEKND